LHNEKGKGLPDVSLYEQLCKILKISLNEVGVLENFEINNLNVAIEENNTRKKLSKVMAI